MAKDFVAESPAKETAQIQNFMQPLKTSRPELEMTKLTIESLDQTKPVEEVKRPSSVTISIRRQTQAQILRRAFDLT